MANRLITFTTDFGLSDHFVGTMKGVVAGIAPQARVIDISHDIAPYNVTEAAFVIAEAWPYFPKGTIHVVVVDPGVGTVRRGVAVQAGESVLVGPDNGVLSWAVTALGGPVRAVSLTSRDLWLDKVTSTFHGRDIFMPVAAHLAAGTDLAVAGPDIDISTLVTLPPPARQVRDGVAEGEVLTVDRFGNVQLTLTTADAWELGLKPGDSALVKAGRQRMTLPYREMFGAVPAGDLVVYCDGAGQVSIAVNGGDAAQRLGLPPGARVSIARTQ